MYVFFLIKKEQIRQKVSFEVGKALKGEFDVKDVGMNFFNLFPNVALSIKDVELKDSTWSIHHQSLLKAKEIFLKVNPLLLLSGEIRISKLVIEDAVIHLFVDTSGYTNQYLFSPEASSSTKDKKGFHLEEIALKNVRIIQSDLVKNKLIDLSFRKLKCEFETNGQIVELDVKLDGTIHSLGFNLAKGSYAKEMPIKEILSHTSIRIKTIAFNNIPLAIDHHPFTFSGMFDFSSQRISNFHSHNKIQYARALTLLPEKSVRSSSHIQ